MMHGRGPAGEEIGLKLIPGYHMEVLRMESLSSNLGLFTLSHKETIQTVHLITEWAEWLKHFF